MNCDFFQNLKIDGRFLCKSHLIVYCIYLHVVKKPLLLRLIQGNIKKLLNFCLENNFSSVVKANF